MSESSKSRKLCDALERLGADCTPYVAGTRGRAGYPDRVITTLGVVTWAEFKDEHTRLAPRQRLVIRRLRERGGHAAAMVWRFVGDEIHFEDEDGNLICRRSTKDLKMILSWLRDGCPPVT